MRQILFLIAFSSALLWGAEPAQPDSTNAPQITFLEIGSTTCIPCKQMEKVLEELREIFGDQMDIQFHDVYKSRKITRKYRVRAIPTQVFLDASGTEIHRHMGFYPTEEITKFLVAQGLIPHKKKQKTSNAE